MHFILDSLLPSAFVGYTLTFVTWRVGQLGWTRAAKDRLAVVHVAGGLAGAVPIINHFMSLSDPTELALSIPIFVASASLVVYGFRLPSQHA